MLDERLIDLRVRGIDAAMELIAQLGEDGLTMRGLASRLGVSTTAMYQVFESKASIVREVRFAGTDQLDAALAPAFAAERDPIDRLHEMSRRYVAFAQERPWLYRVLFGASGLPTDMLSRADQYRLQASLRALQTTLRDGIASGRLRPDLDLELVPLRMWGRNHGLVLLILSGKLGPLHPVLPVDDVPAFLERFFAHTTRPLMAVGEAAW